MIKYFLLFLSYLDVNEIMEVDADRLSHLTALTRL